MPSNIILEGPPNDTTENAERADWVKSDFDNLVYNKGYDVYHDKLIKCACKTKSLSFNSTCQNCRGTAFVLVERNQTKMILQGMNQETKFKEWSEEKIGIVRISALDRNNLSYGDRIIILNGESTYNEILYPTLYQSNLFSFLVYEYVRIDSCYLYISDNVILQKLIEGTDFTITSNIFLLNSKYLTGINTTSLNSGGINYNVGDTFNINTGTLLATGTILTVSGGIVTSYKILTVGQGYSIQNNCSTTNIIGSGSGFTINILSLTAPQNQLQISIRYIYNPQFHVIDLVRDLINATTLEQSIMEIEGVKFPISAVGRRTHIILDKQNYDNTLLLDNT